MPVNVEQIRRRLKEFDFPGLLVEELGWNCHAAAPLIVQVDGAEYVLKAIAEKCGMVVFTCSPGHNSEAPSYPIRRKIEQQVRKSAHEHLIVFFNAQRTVQIWQWVKRAARAQAHYREHVYRSGQTAQALVEKLQRLAFELEEEERLTITDVTARARAALDVEKVTKKFYDRFKKEHETFLKFILGIDEQADRDWYASLMLNRMMFVYFIQKRRFLDGDPDYLRNRLRMVQERRGKDRFLSFYRYFLLRLFHEGLGEQEKDRPHDLDPLLGKVPYLNGGLFDVHELEKAYAQIDIPDEAFERIFDFFDAYTWHLDERPLRADNEINPDVLGYIFEKYINQKQMGAYYTKEDITGYITRNTLIPYLFDAAQKECAVAFKTEGGVWRLLRDDPDRYIYPAVRSGVIVDAASRRVDPAATSRNSSSTVDAASRRVDPATTSRDSSSTVDAASRRMEDMDTAWVLHYFEPDEPVANLSGNLPHWRQEGVTYFITFRLADSIPAEKLRQWLAERDAWLAAHPEPHDAETRAAFFRLFPQRFQQWLDNGYGSCVLAAPEVRRTVEHALRHFDGERYLLDEFVVMPNHVHVVITPIAPYALSDILHSWKSYTSHEINKKQGKTGINWQQESFDHIIRSPASHEKIRQYIRDNPLRVAAASRRVVTQHEATRITSRDGSSTIPESALPEFVRKGMHDPKKRMFDKRYNLTQAVVPGPDGGNLALPTETWREYVERRTRCLDLRAKLVNGEVQGIDDFITLNLDIERFAEDVIVNSEGPELVRAFWKALTGISILDPTCGSGAFLFAALNILEPLYNACLDGMQGFLDDLEHSERKHSPKKLSDFRQVLSEMGKHPNRRHFVLKTIVLNNLYGVDIMDEAVEISKLRLFLKLVAQVEHVEQIEPLPDIDFNIRAGNTLVGFTSLDAVREAMTYEPGGQHRMLYAEEQQVLDDIEEKAREADGAFRIFHEMQTRYDMDAAEFATAKVEVRRRLDNLRDELDHYLAKQYGTVDGASRHAEPGSCAQDRSKVDAASRRVGRTSRDGSSTFGKWHQSHKPFHWFVEFYGIMRGGGFDVVIGNPPYVERRVVQAQYDIQNYSTEAANNLYAYVSERAEALLSRNGRFGFIVPLSSMSTEKFSPLQERIMNQRTVWLSNFDDRPSRLFDGLEHIQLTIILYARAAGESKTEIHMTKCHKWSAAERPILFSVVAYTSENRLYVGDSVPKVGSALELSLLDKLWQINADVASAVDTKGNEKVYYTRKVHAFLNILDFVPEICDGRGRRRDPSEQKTLSFARRSTADAGLCVLNSTLFRWFLATFSDCRNLNRREVLRFKTDLNDLEARFGTHLSSLARRLSQCLKDTSEIRQMKFGGDVLKVQCIIPRHAKPVIDEIDSVLAEYYGFTNEELDFIINYDIKYRMGLNTQEDVETDENGFEEDEA